MLLSNKQREFVLEANHRWNFKGGATRSGKTYLDFKWIIPMRIRERISLEGLSVILGVTKSTIERNVLEPMRKIYGDTLVGSISSDNTVKLFGEKCYALGAEKISQVSKIRGASIKYCYGDEVADWSEDVFILLKSRLDKEYSCFDGTFNPQYPTHWLKQFLDSDADIFSQTYTIDDNPFLSESFKDNLKKEYAGTVYYNRYILGQWTLAEGAIYGIFSEHEPELYTDKPDFDFINVGLDFGGNGSAHAFCATGLKHDSSKITVLMSEKHNAAGTSPERLYQLFEQFLARVTKKYGEVDVVYADSAEQTLINGLKNRLDVPVRGSLKLPIIDRIRATNVFISQGRFFITHDCQTLADALKDAVYDSKKHEDVRLDDGTTDIDSLDAYEYSFERYIKAYMYENLEKGDD